MYYDWKDLPPGTLFRRKGSIYMIGVLWSTSKRLVIRLSHPNNHDIGWAYSSFSPEILDVVGRPAGVKEHES